MPIGNMFATLSPAAKSVWAKSDAFSKDPQGRTLPLTQHLADTAAVAGLIWDHYLAPHVRELLGNAIGSAADARTMAVFLAGIHDLGKAAPAFSVAMPPLAQNAADQGLPIDPQMFEYAPGTRPRHETIGQLELQAWLQQRRGIKLRPAKQLASIVGAHHGAPPDSERLLKAVEDTRAMGGTPWAAVREEFLEAAAAGTGFDRLLERGFPPLGTEIQALLSAIVIMADWIASNDKYFPLEVGNAETRASRAWAALSLPGPWRPTVIPATAAEHMSQRFSLPSGAFPRPVQDAARRAAKAMSEPGLLIIEAAMGEGKTEAALMAAEILASRFRLGGVFVGLPSQATSNAMFDRVTSWLRRLDAADGQDRLTVFLAHGKRELNDEYHELHTQAWAESRPQAVGDSPETRAERRARVVVHSWLADRKRGLLAPFTIGTIDQALMASLKTKHVMLRHLALAGKVVILDEVHAASAYMSVYLERTLRWLGALNVPVILLSATLPSAQRRALVSAYESGKGGGTASDLESSLDYPLVTTSTGPGTARGRAVESSGRRSELTFRALPPDDAALVSLLRDRLRDGGRAAVLRNTVARAQVTHALLSKAFPDADVILAHARFLAFDRAARDEELLRRFGPKNATATGPRPQILVATQVAEQSLDLDMDVMVTDLAPMDLLLQRAGRMHRHAARDTVRPTPMRSAELWIAGVDWHTTPPTPHGSYGPVYERSLLLRTLLALDIAPDRDHVATLPQDIPRLVAACYDALSPEEIPSDWAEAVADAERLAEQHRRDREVEASTFRLEEPKPNGNLTGWITAGLEDPESAQGHTGGAAVRDGMDSVEVLVVQRVGDELRVPAWHPRHGGELLPQMSAPDARLARAVQESSIAFSSAMVRRGKASDGSASLNLDGFIEYLETHSPAQWEASYELNGELIVALDEECRATVAGLDICYDKETGMEVSRHE